MAFEIDFSAPGQSSKELFAPSTGTGILLASGTGAQIAGASTGKKKKKSVGRRDDHLLPDDMHFSSTQLLRLFRKPKFTVSTPLLPTLAKARVGREVLYGDSPVLTMLGQTLTVT